MFVRLSAAICGAGIVFLSSAVAMSRSEIRDVQSRTADRTAYGITIVGAASMYNPYRPGRGEGGVETASGGRYDPSGWAAAIQINFRENFGGVRPCRSASYALVERMNKKAIVKINDVGPLQPGRIIDFDERTMRYFDPTLQLGLIHQVKVTPLHGHNWIPGPIAQR